MHLLDVVIGRNPRNTLIRIGILVCGAFIVFGWVLAPLRLSGISMLPTYRGGTLNFANRAPYWFGRPARGDVVAIRMAGPGAVYVKRIVGMPGEQIEIVEGTVTVNGEPLIERHVVRRARWNLAPFTLTADEFFVIGDNRSMRMEHHDFGRVSRERIIGKLLF